MAVPAAAVRPTEEKEETHVGQPEQTVPWRGDATCGVGARPYGAESRYRRFGAGERVLASKKDQISEVMGLSGLGRKPSTSGRVWTLVGLTSLRPGTGFRSPCASHQVLFAVFAVESLGG